MFYQITEMLAQEHINDAYREAENAHLVREAKGVRKNSLRRNLISIMCQAGLISTC